MTKTYLKYRTRITILASFVLLSWMGLCVRLFQIQVLNGNQYQKAVERQSQKKQNIPATRGNIFDRKSRALTRNIIHYTLSVNPKEVINKVSIARAISKRTGKPEEYYLKRMNSNSKFKYLERISSKIAPFNWHVQILMDVSELQLITDRLRRLPTEIVFDHMGHISTNHGTNNLGFQALINLIKEGRAWVKLSGNYRISSAKPSYKDAEAFARALISASQKRVVWGSDWPHPGLHDTMPNDGALLNALDEYAASDQLKHAILVNNPAELYGFNTSPKGSEYDK